MSNVQTEHLENHNARLTVEVEPDRLDQAMRKAARKISQKGRIPGFRPGKAPYNIVVNLYGREYVLSEALDVLGEEIYREALTAAEIEPYAMGKLEDVQEEGRKLVFVVPKRPTVDLGTYREVRVEPEVTEVTDEMLNEAMENMRQNEALLEPAERPAKMGDQITFEHIYVGVVLTEEDLEDEEEDEETEDEDAEGEDEHDEEDESEESEESGEEETAEAEGEAEDDDDDDDDDEDDAEEETILHEHDFDRVLRDDKDDFFPGFSQEIIGLSANDHKEFSLDIPDDADVNERIAGRTLHIDLHVGQVQARTVPEWSDDLAKRISEDKIETILELRVDTRKRLEEAAAKTANQNVAMKALDKIVEGATVHYPEELVQDYVSDLLADLEQNVLRQQGFTLKDYLRLVGQTEEQLRERYRESAIKRAQRSLVMSEVVKAEQIDIQAGEIDVEIDRIASQLGGEQSSQFRKFLSTPQSRMNIGSELVTSRVLDRLAAIAKGENPAIGLAPAAEAVEAGQPAVDTAQPAVDTTQPAVEPAQPAEPASEPEKTEEN